MEENCTSRFVLSADRLRVSGEARRWRAEISKARLLDAPKPWTLRRYSNVRSSASPNLTFGHAGCAWPRSCSKGTEAELVRERYPDVFWHVG
jgi:hypothetical protein